MFCYNCGNKTVEGASFCAICGKPVVSQPQPQTPIPMQATSPKPVKLPDHQSTQEPPAPAGYPLPETIEQEPPAPAGYPPPEYMRQPVKKALIKRKILIIASVAVGSLVVIGLALFLVLNLWSGSDVEAVVAEPVSLAETPKPIIETPEPTPEEPEPTPEEPDPTPEEPESTPEPKPVFAPVSFTAYGNSYSITGYETGTHTDGSAIVILYGTGFDKLPLRDGQIRVPVWAYLTSGGVEHSSTGCSIKAIR